MRHYILLILLLMLLGSCESLPTPYEDVSRTLNITYGGVTSHSARLLIYMKGADSYSTVTAYAISDSGTSQTLAHSTSNADVFEAEFDDLLQDKTYEVHVILEGSRGKRDFTVSGFKTLEDSNQEIFELEDIPIANSGFRAFILENFDQDGNGMISSEEARNILEIKADHSVLFSNLDDDETANLDGIEYMTNLSVLFISGASPEDGVKKIQSINLTRNTKLTWVYLHNQDLQEIDLSALNDLNNLDISGNQLCAINVSNNPYLINIDCSENNITSLDVRCLYFLERLRACDQVLREIHLNNSGLKILRLENTLIGQLDISNSLDLLDLSLEGCTELKEIRISGFEQNKRFPETDQYTLLIGDETIPPLTDIPTNSEAFKTWLLYNYDADEDGRISRLEAREIDHINLNGSVLSSLTSEPLTSLLGIEYMPNLHSIAVSGFSSKKGMIQEVDLSNNTDLYEIYIQNQKLTSIDLSAQKDLAYLHLFDNRLKELNVKGISSLDLIDCRYNRIERLDVRGLDNLQVLYCSNQNLKELLLDNRNLRKLEAQNTLLEELDLSRCLHLTDLFLDNCPNLKTIYLLNRQQKENLVECSGLEQVKFIFMENPDEETDIDPVAPGTGSGIANENILIPDEEFKCWILKRYDQDNDGEISEEEAIQIGEIVMGTNYVKSLEGIEMMVNLIKLHAEGVRHEGDGYGHVTSIDVSNNKRLQQFYMPYNLLESVDLSACTEINHLEVPGNRLQEISVKNLKNLVLFSCSSNQIKELDVRGLHNLEELHCDNQHLEKLLLDCSSLVSLGCDNTDIRELDLSKCPKLEVVVLDDCMNLEKVILKNGQKVYGTAGYNIEYVD